MRIVITGGSSGIGKHLAGACLDQGDEVAIVAEDAARLEAAREELARRSPRVRALACDVADVGAIERLRDAVLAEWGSVDVLVNCAGFAVYRTFEQSDAREIERLVRVNLIGAMAVTHAFLPAMIARRSGHVVNVASVAGLMPLTPCAAYSTAKWGMVGFSHALRWELAELGIRVHLVCPGRVKTPFFDHETFRSRPSRPEAEQWVPIEKVTRGILRAIERGRFSTTIPWTLGLAIRLRNLAPGLFDRLFLGPRLAARVRELRGPA